MVMGNVVTTTGSGLACPDWPLCYGSVAPPLEINIWFEWGHRLLGGLTSLLILTSTILVWKNKVSPAKWLVTTALGLLGVGVVFGGIIVLIEAPVLKEVLHLLVISFHIILATIIFTLMILSFRSLPNSGGSVNKFFAALFGIVFAQVIIGIFVRYGQATLACPDFPLCRGLLVPDLVDFKVTIHFIHRLMALLIFALATGYFVKALKDGANKTAATVTFILVLTQATFGAYVVWSRMYLPFIILHGANGFLLLGWLAYMSAPFLLNRKLAGEAA